MPCGAVPCQWSRVAGRPLSVVRACVQPGEQAGDIIFVIDQSPHAVFTRHGDSLSITKRIKLVEALCGPHRCNDATMLRDDATMLRDDVAMLRDDVAMLRDDATMLRDDATMLRDDAAMPLRQGRLRRSAFRLAHVPTYLPCALAAPPCKCLLEPKTKRQRSREPAA